MLSLVKVCECIRKPSERGPGRKVKVGLDVVSKILSVAESLDLINAACAEYIVFIAAALEKANSFRAMRTIGPVTSQYLRFRV